MEKLSNIPRLELGMICAGQPLTHGGNANCWPAVGHLRAADGGCSVPGARAAGTSLGGRLCCRVSCWWCRLHGCESTADGRARTAGSCRWLVGFQGHVQEHKSSSADQMLVTFKSSPGIYLWPWLNGRAFLDKLEE